MQTHNLKAESPCKKHTPHSPFKRTAQVSREYHPSSHAAFIQKSTDFGSCLSFLQPPMIKSNFYSILVFLKAAFLYASQLSPSWELYSFLSGIKRSTGAEWGALWAGAVRVQETPQGYSKLHHQKRQCLPNMKVQQSTVRFDWLKKKTNPRHLYQTAPVTKPSQEQAFWFLNSNPWDIFFSTKGKKNLLQKI